MHSWWLVFRRPSKFRRWCVTLQVSPDSLDLAVDIIKKMLVPRCSRLCYQLEIAPSTGQKHLQCYFELKSPVVFDTMKKKFSPFQPHLEVAKGTAQENLVYCTKEETRAPGSHPVVEGDFSVTAGTRTDLTAVKDSILAGKSLRDIANDHPTEFMKYHGGIKSAYSLLAPSNGLVRTWRTRVTFIWGRASGTGKSRMLKSIVGSPPDGLVTRGEWGSNAGIVGYVAQKRVGFDECRPGFIQYGFLLELMDDTPIMIRVLYGQTPFLATDLVISTNFPPWELFSETVMGPWTDPVTRLPNPLHRRLLEPGNQVINIEQPTPEVLAYRQTHRLQALILPPAPIQDNQSGSASVPATNTTNTHGQISSVSINYIKGKRRITYKL